MRVGVAGYGYWGSKHVRVLSSLVGVDVSIIEVDDVRAQDARQQFPNAHVSSDLGSTLERLDALIVAVPPARHYEVSRRAIEAGCHVLVEKPMTTSVADAHDLIELARIHGVILMAGHTFEYNGGVWKLHDLVTSGHLGDIHYLDAARLNLGLYQRDVNVVWDLAPHDISILAYLVGETPSAVEVWATSHVPGNQHDVAYLRLDFERANTHAFVHVSWLDPCKVRRVTVVGTNRMAVFNDLSENDRVRVYDSAVEAQPANAESPAYPVQYRNGDIVSPFVRFREPLLVQDEHFIDCIRTGHQPRTPGESGLAVVEVLAAADESIRLRRRIDITSAQPNRGVQRTRSNSGGLILGTTTTADVPFLDLAGLHADYAADFTTLLQSALRSSSFIGGPNVDQFEQEYASFCGARHCIGVANGTDALELALAALDIGPGDEVIVPANTFVATVEAVCAVGATPRFVDVDRLTLNIDATAVSAAITASTAAIIAVHLYGQPADMTALAAIAERHQLAAD